MLWWCNCQTLCTCSAHKNINFLNWEETLFITYKLHMQLIHKWKYIESHILHEVWMYDLNFRFLHCIDLSLQQTNQRLLFTKFLSEYLSNFMCVQTAMVYIKFFLYTFNNFPFRNVNMITKYKTYCRVTYICRWWFLKIFPPLFLSSLRDIFQTQKRYYKTD